MGQRSVELLIGRLVTDDGLRRRFVVKPLETIRLARQGGLELSTTEVEALLVSPVALWAVLTVALDPRLQKARLGHGHN